MKRPLIALCIGLMLCEPLAAADALRPTDFATSFPLAQVTEGLNAIELTEPVYRAGAQRSLADLRVFNANGEPLPLAMLPRLPTPPPDIQTVDLTLVALPGRPEARDAALQAYAVRFERDRTRTIVEIRGGEPEVTMASATSQVGGYLIDARSLKDVRGRLWLQFADDAPDYAGRVQVLGSEDLVNWRALASGPLTRERRLGDVVEKARFDLVQPPSFLRVAWTGMVSPTIAGARFEKLTAVTMALPRAELAASVGNDGRSLFIDLPEALPIERLYVRTPQLNQSLRVSVFRHVADPAPRSRRLSIVPRRAPEHWIAMGSLDVFRVQRDGVEIEGQSLSAGIPTDRLRIDSEQSFTDPLPVIEAEWRPARIAFAARAPGPYRLSIGNEDAAPGPALDVQLVLPADDPAGTKLPVARIASEISAVPIADPARRAERIAAEAHWSRTLLWGVLLLAVVGLAWMAWRLAAQLRRPAARPSDATH